MIGAASKLHPALASREADAESLPFNDGCFDAVTINFGLHHSAFPLRALAEARQVLRIGGHLDFTVRRVRCAGHGPHEARISASLSLSARICAQAGRSPTPGPAVLRKRGCNPTLDDDRE